MTSPAAKPIASTSRMRCLSSWRLAVAVTLLSPAAFSQAQDEAPADSASAPGAPEAPASAPAAPGAAAAPYSPNFVPAPGTKLEGHLPSSSQSKSDIYAPDTFDLGRSSQSVPTVHGNAENLGVLNVDTAAEIGRASCRERV